MPLAGRDHVVSGLPGGGDNRPDHRPPTERLPQCHQPPITGIANVVLWAALVALAAAYVLAAVYTIARPTRGIPDLLAATYLVPR